MKVEKKMLLVIVEIYNDRTTVNDVIAQIEGLSVEDVFKVKVMNLAHVLPIK